MRSEGEAVPRGDGSGVLSSAISKGSQAPDCEIYEPCCGLTIGRDRTQDLSKRGCNKPEAGRASESARQVWYVGYSRSLYTLQVKLYLGQVEGTEISMGGRWSSVDAMTEYGELES